MNKWLHGDRAYLVPNLPTAPREAYRHPNVVIVTVPPPGTAEYGRIEVELPDGKRLWTNSRNLQPKPPNPEPPAHPTTVRRPVLVLADNEEQPTLW